MTQYDSIKTPQDYVNYTFNISSKGTAQVASELAGLSSTVSNIIGDIAFKTSEFLSHTETMAIGAGLAISAMYVKATQDAIRFEQQVANVKAIGGESIDADLIGRKAMEFSNKFGMATSEMTGGLEALARAGITTTDVMAGVLEEGVKLSKLEGMDLEDSINNLISTTNLLSVNNVDMNDPEYAQMLKDMNQHIVSTSESAPINAENIIQSLQHVGGYASASGMDQDDLFAVIAQLGARGTKGEMAGTALRAFIAAGQKDTAQRALARVGLDVTDLWDANGETMLSISEMKDVLDNALEARGYSKQEKLEFYSDFVGYKQANQIMKIDTSEVQSYKDSIANAWDLGTKLNTILGTTRGNLDRIWEISQNFMTRVGEKILPVVNAILAPIRMGLDLFTKIPFMDNLVAGLALFVGFRTTLSIINNIVPAIGGLFSSMRNQKSYSKGIRGEWEKTRDAIKDAYQVVSNWNDKEKLGQIHRARRGASAEDKVHAENTIVKQMYKDTPFYQAEQIPWDDLEPVLQHDIKQELMNTPEFDANWQKMREKNEDIVNNQISAKEISFSDKEDATLRAINEYVGYIYTILKNKNEKPVVVGGGKKSKQQLNEEERLYGKKDNVKVEVENSKEPVVIINGKETSQTAFAYDDINKIKNNIDTSQYGNYAHIYANNVQKFIEDYNKAVGDLVRKTINFSNKDINTFNREQRRRYEKLIVRDAMTEEGIQYASRANDSDIRHTLRTGVYRKPKNKMLGIRDAQIKEMGRLVGLDFSDIDNINGEDNREAQLAEIRKALQKRNDVTIDDLAQAANDIWVAQESKNKSVRYLPTWALEQNPGAALQIAAIISQPTNDAQKAISSIHDFFADKNNDRSGELLRASAAALFNHMKDNNEVFSDIEKEEITYVLENIARMENTAQILGVELTDAMRIFKQSPSASVKIPKYVLEGNIIPQGIINDLVDMVRDGLISPYDITQEFVESYYKDWIGASDPSKITQKVNDETYKMIKMGLSVPFKDSKMFNQTNKKIDEFAMLDMLEYDKLNDTYLFDRLIERRKFIANSIRLDENNVLHSVTNPTNDKTFHYVQRGDAYIPLTNDNAKDNFFKRFNADPSNFIIYPELQEAYQRAQGQMLRFTYSKADMIGEGDIDHFLFASQASAPTAGEASLSSKELLSIYGKYKTKKNYMVDLGQHQQIQEAILSGDISRKQINSWIKNGYMKDSDAVQDALDIVDEYGIGIDGLIKSKQNHEDYEDQQREIRKQEEERLDTIDNWVEMFLIYQKQWGRKKTKAKTMENSIKDMLKQRADIEASTKEIRNAMDKYGSFDDDNFINGIKREPRIYNLEHILSHSGLFQSSLDKSLDVSYAAHKILGVPFNMPPTDVIKGILRGEYDNIDETTKIFTFSKDRDMYKMKGDISSNYEEFKDLFNTDYDAARFFGIPLLIEQYQDRIPAIKDLLKEGKRFEAYIELMREADDLNFDDLDYEIANDRIMPASDIESLQVELADIRKDAEKEKDDIEFELTHLGTVEYFTDIKTPEELDKERILKENQMMKEGRYWLDWDDYAGKLVSLTPRDIEALNLADVLPPEFINPKYMGESWKKYLYSQADMLSSSNLSDKDLTTVVQSLVDTEWGDKVAIQMPLEEFLGNINYREIFTENTEPWDVLDVAAFDEPNYIANVLKELQERFNDEFDNRGYTDDELKRVNIAGLINNRSIDTMTLAKKQIENNLSPRKHLGNYSVGFKTPSRTYTDADIIPSIMMVEMAKEYRDLINIFESEYIDDDDVKDISNKDIQALFNKIFPEIAKYKKDAKKPRSKKDKMKMIDDFARYGAYDYDEWEGYKPAEAKEIINNAILEFFAEKYNTTTRVTSNLPKTNDGVFRVKDAKQLKAIKEYNEKRNQAVPDYYNKFDFSDVEVGDRLDFDSERMLSSVILASTLYPGADINEILQRQSQANLTLAPLFEDFLRTGNKDIFKYDFAEAIISNIYHDMHYKTDSLMQPTSFTTNSKKRAEILRNALPNEDSKVYDFTIDLLVKTFIDKINGISEGQGGLWGDEYQYEGNMNTLETNNEALLVLDGHILELGNNIAMAKTIIGDISNLAHGDARAALYTESRNLNSYGGGFFNNNLPDKVIVAMLEEIGLKSSGNRFKDIIAIADFMNSQSFDDRDKDSYVFASDLANVGINKYLEEMQPKLTADTFDDYFSAMKHVNDIIKYGEFAHIYGRTTVGIQAMADAVPHYPKYDQYDYETDKIAAYLQDNPEFKNVFKRIGIDAINRKYGYYTGAEEAPIDINGGVIDVNLVDSSVPILEPIINTNEILEEIKEDTKENKDLQSTLVDAIPEEIKETKKETNQTDNTTQQTLDDFNTPQNNKRTIKNKFAEKMSNAIDNGEFDKALNIYDMYRNEFEMSYLWLKNWAILFRKYNTDPNNPNSPINDNIIDIPLDEVPDDFFVTPDELINTWEQNHKKTNDTKTTHNKENFRADKNINYDDNPLVIDIEEDEYWETRKQNAEVFWANIEKEEQQYMENFALSTAGNMFNQFDKDYQENQALKNAGNMFNAFDEDYEENKEKYQRRTKRKAQAQRAGYAVGQGVEKIYSTIRQKAIQTDKWLDENFLKQYSGNYDIWGDTANQLQEVTKPLRAFSSSLGRLSDTFVILLPLMYGVEKVLGFAESVIEGLRMAEQLLLMVRIASGTATEDLAKKEGYETAKKWAQKIKQYIPEDSPLFSIMERVGEYGTRLLGGAKAFTKKAIGFIASNIKILGPIAAGIAVAIGALWLSEQSHAKALKEATEEQEKAMSAAKTSYIEYQNIHNARKAETDAMKRQQLARKESIALYRLEADRAKQLNAINRKSELRNDTLWGEYGIRAAMQKQGLGFIAGGDFESQYEQYEGSTGEIRRIREDVLDGSYTGNQIQVAGWYDAHVQQLGQIEAFAPELQELYDTESRLIDKYGSQEDARNSKEFKKAVQKFADATGLNEETAKKYLDYLQTEANVENARKAMQAQVDVITSEAQANAYKIIYGDEAGIGDMEGVQDAMVYATADQIFKDAYQEMWWSMLMEWLAAIWNQLTLNFGEADKHARAAGAYQDGMKKLAENQGRITEEGVEIAREDQRKDYGNEKYSYYEDTPFGGAIASSKAMKQDWAIEGDSGYYNASESNITASNLNIQKDVSKSLDNYYSEIPSTKENYNDINESFSKADMKTFKNFGRSFEKVSNKIPMYGNKTEIHIHNLNINTEDDPEKMATEFRRLLVDMGDQMVPRQVSRTVGKPSETSNTTQEDNQTNENNANNNNVNNNNANPN